MSDYTPSFERVRDVFSWAYAWRTKDSDGETDLSGLRESNRAEFDRAFAAHDREVAAKAWDEGWNTGWDGRMLHDAGIEGQGEEPNPYRAALVSEPSTPEFEGEKQ